MVPLSEPLGTAMRRFMTMERFRHVYVAYIIYPSVKTTVLAPQLAAAHAARHGALLSAHLYSLALVEILAAVGLLLPRLASAATALLLAVYGVAAIIGLSLGEAPVHLLLYASIAWLLASAAAKQRGSAGA